MKSRGREREKSNNKKEKMNGRTFVTHNRCGGVSSLRAWCSGAWKGFRDMLDQRRLF